jgi:hypothetical protein
VGVALLLRERRAALDSLGGIGDCAVQRGPTGAQSEGRHHNPRVTEDQLSLDEPLAFYSADEPVGIDVNVVESQRCRVAQTNAVLVLRLIVSKTLGACVHDEPAWPYGRIGQDGAIVSNSAVADPLLAAVDLVADDFAIFFDAIGGRL